ncbi:hypothetical protein AB0J86_16345 [Micromonospora sp. NPDC049559]|uniref:hypothetical protein n=1 Tax=Micromonospora sp. NPDC049559 TaxID=3155923 RepID=UPI003449D958
MNVDPTRNMVVFLLARGEGEHGIADVATLDEDGIRQAWERVAREHRARPDEVVALHSEWAATETDLAFVGAVFPDAKLTHNFDRPGPDGWEQAFQAAAQVMAQAQGQQLAEEAADRMAHAEQNGELLPVLWSASSPNASTMLAAMPHWSLVPGRLFVGLAMVAPTPRGTIGMSHLTHDAHQRIGSPALGDLIGQASESLARGLRVDGRRSDRGDLLAMHREGSLAASALALPDFYERMSETLNDERLVVGLPCPDDLIVAGANSGWPEEIRRMVLESTYPTTELVPSVLLVDRAGIQLLAERS